MRDSNLDTIAMKIPALDLFCGLGGWTTAATRTGRIEVRAALNHSAQACKAHYASNPEGPEPFQQDAAEFPFETLRDLVGGGFLLASPSCRDFSSAGRPAARGTGGNGSVDLAKLSTMRRSERNTAWAVVSAIESLEPSCVLVENVRQFYDWRLFPAWRAALEVLGYTVREHELNAANYGAATDRVRAFVTASRNGAIELADSWGTARSCVADCLDPDDFSGNRFHAIEEKPERTRNLIRQKQAESMLSRGILNNVGDGVRMRSVDELAPTLTTQSGTQLMLVDHDRVRILNPNELSRIQGWRDSEVNLPKNRKDASRLIGNAIPVPLAQGIIEQALQFA